MIAGVGGRIASSPLGSLILTAEGDALTGVRFGEDGDPSGHEWILGEAERQLDDYFAGRRARFDLTLRLAGTPFQERVWRALLEIPYGETITYAGLAAEIGVPAAVRAVGAANGQNPLSIVVPCHRVVGSNGSLTGYGGGLEAKRWLLDLERRAAPR